MGKKAPKAPNYAQAAQQTAVASQAAVDAQNRANRPNQTTPWGNSNWTRNPDGTWSQSVTLDPQDQQALDSQQQLGADRSRLAGGMFSRVASEMGSPVDFNKFEQYGQLGDYSTRRQANEDAAFNRAKSRLDPYWEQQMNDMDVRLRTQGLAPGDEAYDRAMRNATMARTDAYSAAQNDAVAQGRQESALAYDQELGGAEYSNRLRTQQIQDELTKRGWSLNEINALISGNEVGMPSLPAFSESTRAMSPDYVNAAQQTYQGQLDRYNARQAGLQGLFSGLGSIAKSGINYSMGFPV